MILEPVLRDMERAIRQARTPRVRQTKLAHAIEATDGAIALLPPADSLDLVELRDVLANVRSGALSYPEWREALTGMAVAIMERHGVDTEDDEDAIWLLMAA